MAAFRIIVCLLLTSVYLSAQVEKTSAVETDADLQQLLSDSLDAAQRNRKLSENYTWRETRIVRKLDKNGSVQDQTSKTYDVTLIEGEEHGRLIMEDGEPLSPEKERKEQEKLSKAIAELQAESLSKRERRLQKLRKSREEEDRIRRAVPQAFHFQRVGEEMVDGRDAWKLHATPNPAFRPFNRETRVLTKLKGTIWIDKQTLNWLRAEIETLDTISFGLLLARVDKGSTMEFEQQMMNGEVWAPRRVEVNFGARLALVRKLRGSTEVLFSEYKKFSADSQVVSTTVVDETQ